MGEGEIPGVFGVGDDEGRRAHQAALAGGGEPGQAGSAGAFYPDEAEPVQVKGAKVPGFGTIFGAVLLALFVDSCAGALIFSAL